ncbi:type IV pilus modification protein PilV [Variovorax sp. Root434]|uniref:type IV pilus modification protein PilV n=1 Tax=Variovorax sp. Root434 TaxID=1736536 RepID=UPI0006FAADE2|nr:type IV pilus modification protein PilV [Variovorax sp. Root434]KQX30262.1 fimbrial assembly protein [Variovorax sp. Root434]
MKTPTHGRAHAASGFAMIEVLVALLIFSFGLLGMAGMLARSLTVSIDAEDRNRAALLANEIASTMWLKNSISVDTTAWQTRVSALTSGGLPNATLTVTAVSGATNSAGTTNAADIVIAWRAVTRESTAANAASKLVTRVVLP